MRTFSEIKRQARNIIKNSKELAAKNGYAAAAEALEALYEEYENKQLKVVVAGELKRGKSSMLNAITGEDNLFPVDANVATNVVTVVKYGKTEKIEAIVADKSALNGIRIEQVERERIPEYVSEQGNPENYKNVQRLDVSVPNEMLKKGLVFVDTPGVGSLNVAHAETTYGFLPEADLLLFTSDSLSGMTETELAFLKRSYDLCKRIVFPVTKKDLNPDYMTIVNDNREKISNTLGIAPEEVKLFPVSSSAKLRYLKTGREAMYKNSGYEELEAEVSEVVDASRIDVFVAPFLARCESELLKIVDDIVAQNAVFEADKEKVTALVAALEDEAARVKKLREDSADWKNRAHLDLMKLKMDVQNGAAELRSDLEGLLENACARYDADLVNESNYTYVLSEINGAAARGFVDIKTHLIEDKVYGIIDNINDNLEIGVNVNQRIFEEISFMPSETIDVVFPKQRFGNVITNKGREIGMKSMGLGVIGGVLGGIAGFFIAGPIGVASGYAVGNSLGGVAGVSLGTLEALKTGSRNPAVVKRELSKHIASTISNMNNIISVTMVEIENEIVKSFNDQLKERELAAKENAEKSKKNTAMLSVDRKVKQKELMALKKDVDDVLEAINGFVYTVDESGKKEKTADENSTTDAGYAFL